MAISKLKLPQGVSAHAFKSPVLLAESLALAVARQLGEAIEAQGTATLVVSGGRSPVAFFQHLAKQKLDWANVVVSLADERWVPVEHADSNAGLLKRYLLQGPAAKAQFLSLYNASASLAQAAEQAKSVKYKDLEKAMRSGSFDTVIGKLSFDAKGDNKLPGFMVYQWKGGKYDYVGK